MHNRYIGVKISTTDRWGMDTLDTYMMIGAYNRSLPLAMASMMSVSDISKMVMAFRTLFDDSSINGQRLQ
jgi:hypothetical protein